MAERHFWKKSKIITGDVTVGTWGMKIICADRVPVGLGAIFWDRRRARFPEKNSKTGEHIQNDTMPRFGFFFQD